MQQLYFWNSYPFVRLSAALILGILAFDRNPTFWKWPIITTLVMIAGLTLLQFVSKRRSFFRLRHLNGLASLLAIAFLGGYLVQVHYHNHPGHHYKFMTSPVLAYEGVVSSMPSSTDHYLRYELDLQNILKDSLTQACGTIFLYVRKDSANRTYEYGDVLGVMGSFYPISRPKNPHEFNYKRYLERQSIYAQAFARSKDVQKVGSDPPSLVTKSAYRIRKSATDIIRETVISTRETAIAEALILGVKDHLDNDVKRAYAAAGAMHVLAVSGLHVGIIYLLLHLMFRRVRNHSLMGKRIFVFVTIIMIWFYATITGLSPSVLRAATMFSLISLGEINSKEGNIFNTLGVSAFILLAFNPYLIYSVGFQLSYAAVFGIAYLFPLLYRLLSPKNILLDKVWSITCVSIAAQIATFPLSIYYFNQFPTYFLATNLVVIPAAFIILLLGISLLALYVISPGLAKVIGLVLEKILFFLNEVISGIEQLPYSLIDWLYLDEISVVFIYTAVIAFLIGLHYHSFKSWVVTTGLILVLIAYFTFQRAKQRASETLIFYRTKETTAIEIVIHNSALLLIEEVTPKEFGLISNQIDPNRIANHLPPISSSTAYLKDEFQRFNSFMLGHLLGKKVLIFDSTTFHLKFNAPIVADIILIEHESVKSLSWMVNHFKAEHIILGNSNSQRYVSGLEKQAKAMKVEIHSLKNKGSYSLEIGHKKRANHGLALFTTNPD